MTSLSKDEADDSERVISEMKALLEGRMPEKRSVERKRSFRSMGSGGLALMLVQSLRSGLRDMGGLGPPEDIVLKPKPKPKRAPQKSAMALPRVAKPALTERKAENIHAKIRKIKAMPKPKVYAAPKAVSKPKKLKPKAAGQKPKKKISGKMRLVMLLARAHGRRK